MADPTKKRLLKSHKLLPCILSASACLNPIKTKTSARSQQVVAIMRESSEACSLNSTPSSMAKGFVSLCSGSDTSTISYEFIVSPRKRRIHLWGLQAKMQKAATLELALLNKAAELKEVRRRWLELYKTMNHPSTKTLILHEKEKAPLNVREHRIIIEAVKTKARALKRKEKSLLVKSSFVRNKRQRLIELCKREEHALSAAINRKSTGDATSQEVVEIIVVE